MGGLLEVFPRVGVDGLPQVRVVSETAGLSPGALQLRLKSAVAVESVPGTSIRDGSTGELKGVSLGKNTEAVRVGKHTHLSCFAERK